MPTLFTKSTPSRRHIRRELSCVTGSLVTTANYITRTMDKIRPRAMNPSITAPTTLAGLIAESQAYERTVQDLSEQVRQLKEKTAQIRSAVQQRELRGKPTKKPWWRPAFFWDTRLELDIEIHYARVVILERRLEEVGALWAEVEMDARRRSAHLLLMAPRPVRNTR